MKHFNCIYEGQKFIIKFSRLARTRMEDVGMMEEAIFGSVVAAIQEVNKLEGDSQFAIVDKEAMSTTVCGVTVIDDVKLVTVITVVELSRTILREGQRVINLGEKIRV